MASRKEYELLFALNARMNGGFSGTFSKAQAEFARLGKELQGLHKVQGDIASYQKQQGAIEATRGKLESLQKQHDLIQKEISETTGSTSGLEREKVRLEQRIKDTETALERQNQKLQATETRLESAGIDTANLAQKDQELTAKIKELEAAQSEAADGAASFGERAASAFEAAGQAIAAAGIATALKEITDAFIECVGIAAGFEETMSTVEALSGSSARDMAALAAEAKELGAATKFTAKEAGDAMGYMAMAGWDATDMLQGMNGVLQLAAASGEDLAMVSDIVTDSLSAFGLAAADTAHFSDVLAAAATNSNTNVAIMGETFKMSASVAGALGYSIEDVATAMGLMANSGVKGSIAGTALRNTFNGLLEGVTLTSAAFGEYEYSAVRADGTMKSFGSTIEELRDRFEQMTEAERVSNAQAIAGQRGYNGLLAILNATDADYASLTNSINNCTGAAERMARVRMDNLNGQLTLMNSAWDALKTTIGEQFIPELRGLAEAGTDAMTWANGFIRDHPALTKGVIAFTGVMGGAAVAITGVNAALKLFNALNVAAMFTGPVGAILGGAAAVAGVTAAVVGLVSAVNDGMPSVKELTESARSMNEAMEEASAAYEKTAEETMAAAGVADTYIRKLEAMGDYAGLSAEKQREYHDVLSLLCQTVPELADSIDLENNTIQGGTAALRANTEAWKQNALAKAMQEKLTAMYAAQADVLVEQEKNRLRLTEAEAKAQTVEEQLNTARARAVALYKESKENGTELTQEYDDLQDTISELALEYNQLVRESDHYRQAMEDDGVAAAEAQAEINEFAAAVDNLTGAANEQTVALSDLEKAIEPVRSEIDRLAAAYNETYDAALTSMDGQYALWEKAEKIVPTSAASVNAALESQAKYWREYNQNIQTVLDNAGDIAGLNEMLAGLDAGDKDTVNFVAGLAQASKTDKKALEDMVQNWQEAKRQQEEAAASFSEYASGLAGEMEDLQEEMVQRIKDMDLSLEAAESARATIQAYIDQAEKMKGPLRTAYTELWQEAQRAFGNNLLASLNSAKPSYTDVPTMSEIYQKAKIGAYASGTDDAPPGWAWVGEEGPELMRLRGGEQILPNSVSQQVAEEYNAYNQYINEQGIPSPSQAERGERTIYQQLSEEYNTYNQYAAENGVKPNYGSFPYSNAAAILGTAAFVPVPEVSTALEALPAPDSGTSAPIKLEVHFHIEAGAPPETVDAWQEYARRGELEAAITEVLEKADADRRRRLLL